MPTIWGHFIINFSYPCRVVRPATPWRLIKMLYTISTPGQQVVLTLTPDLRINSSKMYETDVLLDYAVSSLVSSIVFDLRAVSDLNSIGSWTIFQVVFKAQECGKLVYLYNVQPSIRSVLVEAGILTIARWSRQRRSWIWFYARLLNLRDRQVHLITQST